MKIVVMTLVASVIWTTHLPVASGYPDVETSVISNSTCTPEADESRALLTRLLFGQNGEDVKSKIGLSGAMESDIALMQAVSTPTAMACGILSNKVQGMLGLERPDGNPAFTLTIFRVQNVYFTVLVRQSLIRTVDGNTHLYGGRSFIGIYDSGYNRMRGYAF